MPVPAAVSMPNAGCRPLEFSVEYIGDDGARVRAPLAISSHVRFELAPPVHADRSFKAHSRLPDRDRNFPRRHPCPALAPDTGLERDDHYRFGLAHRADRQLPTRHCRPPARRRAPHTSSTA